jgi:hypothetical protein
LDVKEILISDVYGQNEEIFLSGILEAIVNDRAY